MGRASIGSDEDGSASNYRLDADDGADCMHDNDDDEGDGADDNDVNLDCGHATIGTSMSVTTVTMRMLASLLVFADDGTHAAQSGGKVVREE